MAKEEKNDVSEAQFTILNGLKFGFGFFVANLIGILAIGLLGWIFTLILRAAGVIF
jgi:hypothetical protein